MNCLEASGPNAEQIKYWNEVTGPKWVAMHEMIDSQLAHLGLLAMDRAALQRGERVIDVGCGCGITTVELGRRVGPTGAATGIDISTVMLERAQAHAAGISQVHFENADAQTHHFVDDSFDVVFSRFGVMFFTDPVAAFANLRAAMRRGGRLAFVCWQALQENPWMFVPVMAAAQHIQLPPPPAPDAPGPFSFADTDRVRGILSRSGFTEIAFEPVEETLTIGGGGSLDAAVDFLLQMGPSGAALRAATPEQQSAAAAAIREALSAYVTARGVQMSSAAWIVSARPG